MRSGYGGVGRWIILAVIVLALGVAVFAIVRRWIILAVIVLALGVAVFAIVRRNSVPRPERTAVERVEVGVFTREVSGSGVVEASRERNLSFNRAGVVKDILVSEGDTVTAGTLLATLDVASLNRELAAAQANLTSARANLERTIVQQNLDKLDLDTSLISSSDTLDNARESLSDAEKTLETTQKLFEAGAASRDELTKAQQAFDSAQRRLEQASVSLESVRAKSATFTQLSEAQISSARAQVSQLETTVANLEEQIQESGLLAPFAGTVTSIGFKQGDQVTQANLLKLVDTSSLMIKANFDENRALELKVGQKALITADANTSLIFEGRVKRVGTVASRTGSAAQIAVELEFTQASVSIRPGFTVTTKVIINALDDVLLIPLEAITEEDTESFVFRVLETQPGRGNVQRVGVTVLDRNATLAAVESPNLKSGDLIAVINLEELEAGDLVSYDPVASGS